MKDLNGKTEKMETSFTARSRKGRSVTVKIFLIIVILILPFNLVSVFTANQSVKTAKNQIIVSMESISNLYIQQLDNRINATNYFLYELEERDVDFIRVLAQEEKDADYFRSSTNLVKKLTTNINTTGSADVYFCYKEDFSDFYITMSSEMTGETKENVKNWLLESDWEAYAKWTYVSVAGAQWLLRACNYGTFHYGAMISLDNLGRTIEEAASLSGMELVFGAGKLEEEKHSGKLLVETVSGKSEMIMYMTVPESESYKTLSFLQMVSLILIFFYIMLIPVLIGIINVVLLVPLKKLIAENYEIELQNLHLQIHPHFLMNIFNLLFSLAQIEDYSSIQKLALYLSNYFRHIFQNEDGRVAFEQEYQLIQDYVEISGIRYPESCEMTYEIDPETLHVRIPSLLIHNFVENVFKHVIQCGKVTHVKLRTSCEKEDVLFIISDDGGGMEPEMVENVNNGIFKRDKKDRNHVGLKNSYQRIKSMYGKQGSLFIESKIGEGTCFTIRIPSEHSREYSLEEESI